MSERYGKLSHVEYQGEFRKSRGYTYKVTALFKTREGYVYDLESVSEPNGFQSEQHAKNLCSVKHGELIRI